MKTKSTMYERLRNKVKPDPKRNYKRRLNRSFVFDPVNLQARLCQKSYARFVKEFWEVISPEKLEWNWHMDLLCHELQEMLERVFLGKPKKHDLLINISPGTSKSSICSVLLLAWSWTRMPTMRHINASHTEQLVHDLSRKARIVVESEKYKKLFPWVVLSDVQNTKSHWVNTNGGERVSCTVSGKPPTGFHAHVIVVDDPIDPKKAESELDRATANTFVDHVLPSRKVNKAVSVTILVMQRLHEDDPSARFIARKNVKHICLPAEVTDDIKPEYLKKKYVNGLMDPVRLTREVLDEEHSKGDYYYSGQYLQSPTPKGGGMFRVDKLIFEPKAPKKFKSLVRYWDKAATQGSGAFSVGTLMGLDFEGKFWILDVVRGQWDSGVREQMILAIAKKDGKSVIVGLEQEPGSGGKESTEGTVRRLAGYKVRVHKPTGSENSKVARADPFSTQVNFGNVRVLNGNWNDSWKNELRFFPYGKYKDQVDSSTGAFSVLAGKGNKTRGVSAI